MSSLLGKQVMDTVTGAAGTATAHVFYLHGPERVCIEFLDLEDKPHEMWVDAGRVKMLEASR